MKSRAAPPANGSTYKSCGGMSVLRNEASRRLPPALLGIGGTILTSRGLSSALAELLRGFRPSRAASRI